MAFDTYSDLQTEITRWAWRDAGDTDFAMSVPGFVALAHNRICRQLRVREMEASATLTLSSGSATLPDDYLQYRQVLAGGVPLNACDPAWAEQRYLEETGSPAFFSIKGDSINVWPRYDGSLTLDYFQTIPPLDCASATNWLLTKHPELYLYGALVEAATFMMDDGRMATWGGLYDQAMQAAMKEGELARYANTAVRVSGPTP
jgi:hypothetical protein